eukprot:2269753-Rhodomonas_salina.1
MRGTETAYPRAGGRVDVFVPAHASLPTDHAPGTGTLSPTRILGPVRRGFSGRYLRCGNSSSTSYTLLGEVRYQPTCARYHRCTVLSCSLAQEGTGEAMWCTEIVCAAMKLACAMQYTVLAHRERTRSARVATDLPLDLRDPWYCAPYPPTPCPLYCAP